MVQLSDVNQYTCAGSTAAHGTTAACPAAARCSRRAATGRWRCMRDSSSQTSLWARTMVLKAAARAPRRTPVLRRRLRTQRRRSPEHMRFSRVWSTQSTFVRGGMHCSCPSSHASAICMTISESCNHVLRHNGLAHTGTLAAQEWLLCCMDLLCSSSLDCRHRR